MAIIFQNSQQCQHYYTGCSRKSRTKFNAH